MIKIELIQISLNRHRRSPSPKPKKPPEKEVLLGENIFFFRACLNFIAQNFYKYFEMDFSPFDGAQGTIFMFADLAG